MKIVYFFLAACFLTSCAGYMSKMQGVFQHYERYDYNQALAKLSNIKPKSKDRLLYFLDKGMILHAAGQYEASIDAFHDAERISEEIAKHAGHEALSLAANENVMPYVGDKYERLMIPIWNALNYAALGQNEEALIEIRHFHVVHHALYGHDLPKAELRNPFNHYLAGLVWEANAFLDDARIDYRKVHAMNPQIPEAIAAKLSKGMGEVVVVLEAGFSPERRSSEWQNPQTLQFFPVPQYSERPSRVDHLAVRVNGEQVTESQSLVSLTTLAMAELAEQLPKLIAKAVGRTVLKEGAAVAVGKEVDKDVGIFMGLLLLATNQVDRRHWSTLPDTLHIARVSLPEGTHTLTLRFLAADGNELGEPFILNDLLVQAGKRVFFPYRVFE